MILYLLIVEEKIIKHITLLLKSQQKLGVTNIIFTEEVNRIALSANDDKKIQ